jgi:diguanylate cyclase (GGDEF)-like protein
VKFEIQPELFDNFIDAICIMNEEFFPVYFNSSFAAMLNESSMKQMYKKRMYDLLHLDDFEWNDLKAGFLTPLESKIREIKFSAKNRSGQLQITWQSIQVSDGKYQIILYFKDVSLESELARKYHEQLTQKNETLSTLDEHLFKNYLIKDVLEKVSREDDPIVMLRHLFRDLSRFLQLDCIMYLREGENQVAPSLKAYSGPPHMDEVLVKENVKAMIPKLLLENISNLKIGNLNWSSFRYKDDSDQFRHFVFGKSSKFVQREEELIESICEPLSFALDNRELFKKAITDEMTDLYNYRYFKLRLHKELYGHEAANKKMGLLILDIDHFKKVNDTYGHLAGDFVLKEVANCLKKFCRNTDIPARYGGEEFAIIIDNIDKGYSIDIGERLRQAIESLEIKIPGMDQKLHITASIGMSIYPHNAKTPTDLIRAADQCLYEAKKLGRNMCVISQKMASEPVSDSKSSRGAKPSAA